MIELGCKVKDSVTGLEGIVVGRTHYLNGCIQWGVRPPIDKDGKVVDAFWIDEAQLERTGDGIAVASPFRMTGGPSHCEPTGTSRP